MTDQEIRLKFGEMNAGEMRLARALVAWHEREITKLKEDLTHAERWRDKLDTKLTEVVEAAERAGWDSVENSKNLPTFITYLAEALSKAQGILKACLSVMPFGNLETHTFENLPGRIADLASEIASLSLENERLEAELAALRQPILADDGRSLGQATAKPTTSPDWTPAVGDVVRLKSGGPAMVVTDVDPKSLMCAWMNANNELQVEPITTLCLAQAKP